VDQDETEFKDLAAMWAIGGKADIGFRLDPDERRRAKVADSYAGAAYDLAEALWREKKRREKEES
jgi:hypothetical protein